MTRSSLCRLAAVAAAALFLATPGAAQDVSISVADGGSLASTTIGLLALITVLSVVPGLAIMVTCFPMIVTVLSILRQAIGLQQSPPNMLIVSLAMFLSYFVMEPVFTKSWENGLQPYVNGQTDLGAAFEPTFAPFRDFMEARVDPDVIDRMLSLRNQTTDQDGSRRASPAVLIPSFLLSEIERAFQIGFLVFLPFMIIDLIVAAVLMSMGMMMVPPAIVSLPFKLAFFVLADGWTLISEALVKGYF